ncbi:hypothetical protein, unlikely [Trypanosoma brucei gambiense DAL972]|uniref:T. brucei spp.-specific protein n=1 Tax=Trypanosoma brucei gambiense (strain MHOM/CI/86/DAL972) TaxID=679716 RepID=D0A3B0_TRYB9|nr:hypothetical protein, unlikely [Trypanosoma brucei gambiense DAL972]CBH15754.1 hypothetical protein, unlikely [Trypanosoma brucei gambiense DAL972]|eukprot:XP_011778018.1 hypothetical protein, unlikely [Trypanosoma brucei gambiense DAL972]
MVKLWMATLWLYVCCFADGVFLPPNFNAEFSASIFTVSSDCERVFCVATVTSHLTYLRQRAFRGWCVCVCVCGSLRITCGTEIIWTEGTAYAHLELYQVSGEI